NAPCKLHRSTTMPPPHCPYWFTNAHPTASRATPIARPNACLQPSTILPKSHAPLPSGQPMVYLRTTKCKQPYKKGKRFASGLIDSWERPAWFARAWRKAPIGLATQAGHFQGKGARREPR
ncbi:MAG: hypothetical protein N2515_11540, partial [Deltaproteobacteria bacterium]|nr:hypothetical protein [Deltaproteobacteria bacterium]